MGRQGQVAVRERLTGAEGGKKVRDHRDPVMHKAGMRGERKGGVQGGPLAPVLGGWRAVFRNGEMNLGFMDASFICFNPEAP